MRFPIESTRRREFLPLEALGGHAIKGHKTHKRRVSKAEAFRSGEKHYRSYSGFITPDSAAPEMRAAQRRLAGLIKQLRKRMKTSSSRMAILLILHLICGKFKEVSSSIAHKRKEIICLGRSSPY